MSFLQKHKKILGSVCISAFLLLVGYIVTPLLLWLVVLILPCDEVVGYAVSCLLAGTLASLPVNAQVFRSDLHNGIKAAVSLFLVLMFALVLILPMLSFS